MKCLENETQCIIGSALRKQIRSHAGILNTSNREAKGEECCCPLYGSVSSLACLHNRKVGVCASGVLPRYLQTSSFKFTWELPGYISHKALKICGIMYDRYIVCRNLTIQLSSVGLPQVCPSDCL